MSRFPFKDFDGLTPVFDRKKLEKPYVLDGRNFLVTADGIASVFGRQLIAYKAILNPEAIQTFKVNSQSEAFFLNREGIFHFDSVSGRMEPVFLIATPGTPSDPQPWTTALVGGKQYFARHGVGLIQYVASTNTWAVLSGGAIPNDIVACTQTSGRLIVLTLTLTAWSAIDDGTDFTPSTATGAGFQSLSIINSGCTCIPYKVLEYAGGFIVYTSEGLARFEAVQSLIPFRFKVLSRKHKPLNPYCVIEVGQYEHIMLTRSGFFSSAGEIPQPWQPVMGQFLHEEIVPKVDTNIPAVIRLDTDFDRQTFVVSFSPEQSAGRYIKSYVLYLPSGKWGSFDKPHTGLIDVHIDTSPNIGFHWGYCDTEGSIWEFYGGANDISVRDYDESIWLYEFLPTLEYTARVEIVSGVSFYHMPTFGHLHSVDESVMRAVGIPGQYNLRSEIESPQSPESILPGESTVEFITANYHMRTVGQFGSRMTRVIQAKELWHLFDIAAWVELGLIRAGANVDLSELSLFHEMDISSDEVAIQDQVEDYMLDYIGISEDQITEDWNVLDGEEDWGFGNASTSQYKILVRGSLDGYKTWRNEQGEEIKTDPVEVYLTDGKTQFCSLYQVALYHLIKFYTVKAGDQFDLKVLSVNLEPAGFLR